MVSSRFYDSMARFQGSSITYPHHRLWKEAPKSAELRASERRAVDRLRRAFKGGKVLFVSAATIQNKQQLKAIRSTWKCKGRGTWHARKMAPMGLRQMPGARTRRA